MHINTFNQPLSNVTKNISSIRILNTSNLLSQRLLITDTSGNKIVDTKKALPKIENTYSPNSYDGYIIDMSTAREGEMSVTDLQGEQYSMLYTSALAGEYLTLSTKEEDNGSYNFNLRFKYDNPSNSFYLTQILLNENNTKCDQSLLSTSIIERKNNIPTSIQNFDGKAVFHELQSLYTSSQISNTKKEKLMPESVSNNFNAALQAYKTGNNKELTMLTNYFVSDGGRDEVCDPNSYMVERYYFPKKVTWSNDLGFLLEQSGHYQEAVVLLEHIIQQHSDRVVTYLNLADAYWALDQKESAIKAYSLYFEKMTTTGKNNMIPRRVISVLFPNY